MFKPVDFYSMERVKELKKDENHLDTKNLNLKQEFSKLSDRNLIKYIKQAESAYDLYAEVIHIFQVLK